MKGGVVFSLLPKQMTGQKRGKWPRPLSIVHLFLAHGFALFCTFLHLIILDFFQQKALLLITFLYCLMLFFFFYWLPLPKEAKQKLFFFSIIQGMVLSFFFFLYFWLTFSFFEKKIQNIILDRKAAFLPKCKIPCISHVWVVVRESGLHRGPSVDFNLLILWRSET